MPLPVFDLGDKVEFPCGPHTIEATITATLWAGEGEVQYQIRHEHCPNCACSGHCPWEVLPVDEGRLRKRLDSQPEEEMTTQPSTKKFKDRNGTEFTVGDRIIVVVADHGHCRSLERKKGVVVRREDDTGGIVFDDPDAATPRDLLGTGGRTDGWTLRLFTLRLEEPAPKVKLKEEPEVGKAMEINPEKADFDTMKVLTEEMDPIGEVIKTDEEFFWVKVNILVEVKVKRDKPKIEIPTFLKRKIRRRRHV